MFVDSQAVQVLLNPRIEKQERERIINLLMNGNQLSAHVWFATSGTSGKYKFVALSNDAILHSAHAVNKHFNATSADTWVNVLPPFHVGGYGIFARAHLVGAKVINLYAEDKKWDPLEFVQVAHHEKVTLSALVPTQLHDLIKAKAKAPESMRAVVIGGGSLDFSLYTQASQLGWKLFPSYGLTECASQVATAPDCDARSYKILDHMQIEIDDTEHINIKSPSLLTTYAFIDERGVRYVDPKKNGWLQTEDKGCVNGDYLEVYGRSSGFLKIGGESVNLQAVQNDLDLLKMKLDIMQSTVLFPQSDERLGQVIALCVEGIISSEITKLVEQHNQRALPFERIRRTIAMDVIPRTPTGKAILAKIS